MDLFSGLPVSQIDSSILTVSKYLDNLKLRLKSEKAKIVGEISGIQMYEGRSYMYYSIKDTKDQSTIKCFMWKNDYKLSGVSLKEGMEVVLTAYPDIYKPNGGLSLQVELIELIGEGALQKAYEELKAKLNVEGLFDPSRKRMIPEFPHRIGVITSKSGAVINDFLSNIGKFGYEILFVDSKVEGQDAIRDLLLAMHTLEKKDIDVLVIMRGGGSLESFVAFNNEALVRAVASFPVPVLTGIGHDKDAPLVSLVSDLNVSTPTAVTHILNKSWNEVLSRTSLLEEKLFSTFSAQLKESHFMIENSGMSIERSFDALFETFKNAERTVISSALQIERSIARMFERIDDYTKDIVQSFVRMQERVEGHLKESLTALQYANPERQLSQGYSIIKNKGKVIKNATDVSTGDELEITLACGTIQSKVI